jgi:hypothetical protein
MFSSTSAHECNSPEEGFVVDGPTGIECRAHGQRLATAGCPSCGRPAAGRAFGSTDAYLRCSLGHVFPAIAEGF